LPDLDPANVEKQWKERRAGRVVASGIAIRGLTDDRFALTTAEEISQTTEARQTEEHARNLASEVLPAVDKGFGLKVTLVGGQSPPAGTTGTPAFPGFPGFPGGGGFPGFPGGGGFPGFPGGGMRGMMPPGFPGGGMRGFSPMGGS